MDTSATVSSPDTIDKPVNAALPHRNTSFLGDVLRLVSGTGIAQIICIASAPVLTRLYAPEAFGISALFASLSGVISVVACMQYEAAIVLPDNDREAANLFGVSLCFSFLIAALTFLLVRVGGSYILQWIRMPGLTPYLLLLPVVVLISGVFTSLNFWNTRIKHFTRLSIARCANQLTGTSATLGAGFSGYPYGSTMIVAGVGSQFVATVILGGQTWRGNGKFFLNNIRWREMLLGLKRYKKFPIYSSWAVLLNTASWQLPAFMFGAFFSPDIVGFYSLGFRILQMPMSLIGVAISHVFIQRAAQAKLEGVLAPLVEDLFKRLIVISLFPMLTLTVVGQDMYVVFFGKGWSEAGVYTQILSIWAFFWFISSPLTSLFCVLELQEFELGIQIAIFISRFIALWAGGVLGSARIALFLFAASGALVYGYMGLAIITKAGVPWLKMIRVILFNAALFIPAGGILSSLKFFDTEPWILVIVSFGLLGCYLLYALKKEPYIRKIFSRQGATV